MPTLLSARQLLIAAAFAAATLAPVAVPFQAAAAECPSGEEGDLYTGTCTPVLVPNSPAPVAMPAANECPPGVTGAECQPSTGNEAGPVMPQLPGQVEQTGPEEELQDVDTPDY
ncbi:hypothetical protein [Mycolicibacterium smegmatis]|uniref:Intersectin-EH binding protein Ibp1 n=1 Tax=Mycolicibacterium smegmatis (strain ATCC 700084 / mc(2)155) TaxID=246196 RepID=A0R340_MYCS2|nr:hypothetical protein [Mycolicibacterium smegmatis]ABK72119.1 hypothetical protein MSMEG_5333 [Mycolicibacterium smegmatis MC2 155]AIU10361.1 hypothetical protein LJ00_26365 [Mycolicibacterium smegmatis MC2 155]AIU16986.1 hypothetical protein LI99_26370 [Mycolicibacterium smegmatis]AIU23609.1 hypothetical protein LI98_26375 [Mycolicibacterium smegmatis]MBE9618867.1 hypothetical protein [Mycolicibacterium smegmatis]